MNKDDTKVSGQRGSPGGDGIIQNGRGGRKKTSWFREELNALEWGFIKLEVSVEPWGQVMGEITITNDMQSVQITQGECIKQEEKGLPL
jgi:hypothetical protein